MTSIPVQVDTKLADASQAAAKHSARIAGLMNQAHRLADDAPKTRYVGRRQVQEPYRLTDAEALEVLRTTGTVNAYDNHKLPTFFSSLESEQAGLDHARAAIREGNDAYTGWSRFFLVVGGHIHSSMSCSTCNNGQDPTDFGWLPQLSGLSEADAVHAHGAVLCTVCFPSAPVEWTNAYELAEAAKQAARCEGSGKQYDTTQPHELRRMSKWGTCTGCHTVQTVTPNGNIRAHKKP